MTFQQRIMHFDKLTRNMNIPENHRDISLYNVEWLLKNLESRNKGHSKIPESLSMLQVFHKELKK